MTEETLRAPLGMRLGCVRALFSVLWLHMLVEFIGAALGLKAPFEQARSALQRLQSVTRDQTFSTGRPLLPLCGGIKQNKSLM